jgi:hypothetical protein
MALGGRLTNARPSLTPAFEAKKLIVQLAQAFARCQEIRAASLAFLRRGLTAELLEAANDLLALALERHELCFQTFLVHAVLEAFRVEHRNTPELCDWPH